MRRVDTYFLLLATVLLLAGSILGIKMGASADFQLAPVHAHINLAGWASLALFGLTYRCFPQLAERRLAMFHFILSATSSVLLPIGIGLAVLRHAPTLAIVASFLFVAGVLIFLVQVIGLARTADRA
jgi:predicted membrane channel-forming protein YqfA (hemolysin III family)